MGPTGSGKSYVSIWKFQYLRTMDHIRYQFIDLLTGQLGQRAGNSLASVTSNIEATRLSFPSDPKKKIVLVDTPGFDDTTRSDMEILSMISHWLKTTYAVFFFLSSTLSSGYRYERDVKLSGLIYLHRITDNRMAGSLYKNLRMFGELCGDLAMSQVVLVTTMWERVVEAVGEAREKELHTIFWKSLRDKGSEVDSLKRANDQEAWGIINKVVNRYFENKQAEAVLLQEELVDQKIKLNETQAGKALYTDLQRKLAEQKESMKTLLVQVQKSSDPHLTKELQKEYDRIQIEFDQAFDEAQSLKRSLWERIFSTLFPKPTRSVRPWNCLS